MYGINIYKWSYTGMWRITLAEWSIDFVRSELPFINLRYRKAIDHKCSATRGSAHFYTAI